MICHASLKIQMSAESIKDLSKRAWYDVRAQSSLLNLRFSIYARYVYMKENTALIHSLSVYI